MKIHNGTINLTDRENYHIISMILESSQTKRWYPYKDQKKMEMTIMDSIPEMIRNEEPFLMLLRSNRNPESILSFAQKLKWQNEPSEENKIENQDSIESGDIKEFIRRVLEKGFEQGKNGKITFEGDSISELRDSVLQNIEYKVLSIQQSNSSFVIGNRFICKFIRKIQAGENPDFEIPRKLYAETQFRNAPRPIGQMVYRDNQPYSIMSVHSYIENSGDYWEFFTKLSEQLLSGSEKSSSGDKIIETLTGCIEELAKAVGDMHISLSMLKGKDFASEPTTGRYISGIKSRFLQMCHNLSASTTNIEINSEVIDTGELGKKLEPLMEKINFGYFQGTRITRVHGDLHLGQILRTHNGPVIIDFEGEPLRTLRERTMKHSPVKDVAGIVRSIDYALNFKRESHGYDVALSQEYSLKLKTKFLEEYWKIASGSEFLPDTFQAFTGISEFFELDKAVYELNYEISNRPQWSEIPAMAILKIMQRLD